MNKPYPKIHKETPLGMTNRSTLNKLIQGENSSSSESRHYILTDPMSMNRISREASQNHIDSDSIMQVLPDMEHVIQILVGTILNPKDMSQADLNIVVDDNGFNSELSRGMLAVIIDHFKNNYKLEERLDKVLEDIIATHGAYIQAVIPENSLDLIINGNRKLSTEAFDSAVSRLHSEKPLGILGCGNIVPKGMNKNVSMESMSSALLEQVSTVGFEDSDLTVTDNFSLLKQPELAKQRRQIEISRLINRNTIGLEEHKETVGLSPSDIAKLYQKQQSRYNETIIVDRPEYNQKPSVGHPLVIDLPSSAVIPVYIPGRVYEHVGYFILLDEFGRPTVYGDTVDYYNDLKTDFNNRYGSADNSSELLRITKDALGGTNQKNAFDIERIHQSYASIVEADLKKRLLNGAYREEFDLGFSDEVKRIMFSRHLKRSRTRILYLPAELVVYIAFHFDKNGMGISMLARSKILANMRSVLLFAETMGGVRNAVGRKKVNITLDPEDPDKAATLSEIQQLILESGRRGFPIGAPDPGHTLDYLNRAGYDFSVNAESEDFHQMSVDYDDYNTNINAGNPDLQDRLKKMHYSSMSCPPEKVDPDNSSDFAVSVVQNDLLMARRVKSMQKAFCDGMSKFIKVYTLNSSILVNALLEYIKDNAAMISQDYQGKSAMVIVEDFIKALRVRLPEPDTSRTELMIELLDKQSDLIDKVLAAYISEDLFPDEFLAKEGSVEKATKVIHAHFMRQFIHDNGVMPEVGKLYEMEEGKPVFNLFDIQKVGLESLGTAIQEYISQMEATKEQWTNRFGESEESDDGDSEESDDDMSDEEVDDSGEESDDEVEDMATADEDEGEDLDASEEDKEESSGEDEEGDDSVEEESEDEDSDKEE